MIVRKHLRWRRVLSKSRGFLGYIIGLSSLVYAMHIAEDGGYLGSLLIHLPFSVVAMLATALAIFLAFRNNSAYDRWREARKIRGGIVNSSRTFGRQVMTLTSLSENSSNEVAAFQKELIYRHIAWINALRLQLRRETAWEEIEPLVGAEEYKWVMARQNHATQLVQKQGLRLAGGLKEGLITESRFVEVLDETLTSLYDLQGKLWDSQPVKGSHTSLEMKNLAVRLLPSRLPVSIRDAASIGHDYRTGKSRKCVDGHPTGDSLFLRLLCADESR